jgi:hypothetical protein
MERLCFAGTFTKMTPKQQEQLSQAYIVHSGRLPSRRELRMLSGYVGISQSRIRRWFLQHTTSSSSITANQTIYNPSTPSAPEEEDLSDVKNCLSRIEKQLDTIEGEVSQTAHLIAALEISQSETPPPPAIPRESASIAFEGGLESGDDLYQQGSDSSMRDFSPGFDYDDPIPL